MRVNPNLYAGVNASMQQSEQQLQIAMNQLSSGKRVALPSDDPQAFSADVRSLADSAAVDTYTKNSGAVLKQAQLADSALSSVVTTLTQAVSLGTEGGNGTVSSAQRSALAAQVQGLLANVVNLANTTSNGVALFAGTSGVTTPFVANPAAPNGYTYVGNSEVNQAQIGQSLSVPVGVAGSAIFMGSGGNVLGSMQALISALQSGSTADLGTAVSGVTAAIGQVGQARASYGSTVNQINSENDYLSQESVSLTTQQSNLTGVDLATAATNLTQAQTAQSAILAMAAKILPTSLLTYLQS